MAYVTLQPRDSSQKRPHPLTIKMTPVQGVDAGRRIDAYNDLYPVEERWDNELEQTEEHALRRMCQVFALDLATRTSVSDSELIGEKMSLLMAFAHRHNLGRDTFAFPLIWILKGYIDQLKDRGEDAIVYQQLKAWANAHRPRWQDLNTLGDEMHGRVPD